jgi:hypothetical protein
MVEQLTGKMSSSALTDESLLGWPEHRLRHTESFVYTEVGDNTKASAAQDRALTLYRTADQSGNRAMVQLHRAACIIRDKNVGDGMRHIVEVLDTVPTANHNTLLYAVARRALGVVPPTEQHHAEYSYLRDRLLALPASR